MQASLTRGTASPLIRAVFTEFDGERRRIEGELHDGVQQDLAAISGRLQLALDPSALAVEFGEHCAN